MNDRNRLELLRRYEIMDSATEKAFDDLTWLAAQICGSPISLINLIDDDRLWTKSVFGTKAVSIPRARTFCSVVVEQNATLVVPDATRDPRFNDFPDVAGGVRSYLGAPLLAAGGLPLGTLCVIDTEPREYTREQLAAITRLAEQVMHLIEVRIAQIKSVRLAARVATQNAIVLAAAQSSSPDVAVRRCLTEVVARSRWTAGRFLTADDRDHDRLVQRDAFARGEGSPLGAFIEGRDGRPAPAEGLARRAARTRRPAWVDEVRGEVAGEALLTDGVRTAIAVPVVVGDRVIGVFELFSSEAFEIDELDLEAFVQITAQIASAFERQLVREDLFSQKEFLNAVLENLADGVVACDAAGNLTLFNNATRELHGMGEQNLPPERWSEHYSLLRPDGVTPMPTTEVPLRRAFAGEVIHDVEMVIAPTESAARRVLTSGRAMYARDGRKLGAVVAMTDITARVAAEKAQAQLVAQLEDSRASLERRVNERTADLSSLNDSIPQIVWQTAADGHLLYLNRKFEDYTGLPKTLEGFTAAIHPEDLVASEAAWRTARAAGDIYQVELRLKVRTGAYRWFLSRAVAQRSSNGQIVKWFGTTTDIHDTKETEAILGNFFSLPGVMLALVSAGGTFTRVNGAWTETLGYPASELTGRSWVDFIHADDRARLALDQNTPGDTSSAVNLELRFRRRDGSYAWLNWSSSPRDGISYCVARDVSASKTDQMRLQSVFSSSIFGIFFWDAAGPIANANDTFLDIIGYTRRELDDGLIDWTKITPPEWAPADAAAIATIQATGASQPYEKEYLRKDGTRVPILLGASALPGDTLSGLAFIIDMTRQRATENRFEALVERSPFPTIVMNRRGSVDQGQPCVA